MYNWYQYSFHILLAVARDHLILKGISQNEPEILSLGAWVYYLRALLCDQVLLAGFGLFLVGVAVAIRRRRKPDLILLISLVVPYIIFSTFQNKDIRFTLPLLPFVAILSVACLPLERESQRWPIAVLVGLNFLNGIQLINADGVIGGRSWMLGVRTSFGDIAVLKERIQFIGPPVKESASITKLVEFLGSRIAPSAPGVPIEDSPIPESWRLSPAESRKVVIGSNSWFLDQYSVRFWSLLRRSDLKVSWIDGRNPLVFRESIHSGFLVTKTDSPGEEADDGLRLVTLLLQPDTILSNRFRLIARFPLADGSAALVWKNIGRSGS